MLALKSSHIYIDKNIANKIFKNSNTAYVTYLKEQKRVLIANVSNNWFTKVYNSKVFMLKDRCIKGSKTIDLKEVLIDNSLNDADRKLKYEIIEKNNIIKITI